MYTIIGHRGFGSNKIQNEFLENSLESFQNAFNQGADEIEFDLSLSKDGIVFVYHDSFIRTGFLQKKLISNLEFKEIKKYKSPVTIDFSELFEELPEKTFVIELKAYTDYRYISDLVCEKFINKSNIKNFRFISFSFNALKHIKKINPDIYCIYIGTCIDQRFEPFIRQKHLELCQENKINEITGHWFGFIPKMINKAKELNLEVGIGIVNGQKVFNYCKKNNVRRIYTDRIKLIIFIIFKNLAKHIIIPYIIGGIIYVQKICDTFN